MLTPAYWWTLLAVSLALLALRPLLSRWPLEGRATRLTVAEALLLLLGLAVLGFHCSAMFFPDATAAIPGTDGASSAIRALDVASMVWFVVPAGFVVLALRRLWWPALSAVVLGLAAVGVTMYDGGPLDVHLVTLFVTVALLALVASALLRPPAPAR
ncbi:MAG TPA: hypothetical protein VGP51_07880 [Nocardioidaceae bacterium]|nr:hypothetical protein [Nocardioidaceae bacterium]